LAKLFDTNFIIFKLDCMNRNPVKLTCLYFFTSQKFMSFSFLEEQSLNKKIYPGMLIKWLMTQLQADSTDFTTSRRFCQFYIPKRWCTSHSHLESTNSWITDYNSNARDIVLNNAIFGSLGPLGHQTSFMGLCEGWLVSTANSNKYSWIWIPDHYQGQIAKGLGTKGTFSWHLLSDPWGSDWAHVGWTDNFRRFLMYLCTSHSF